MAVTEADTDNWEFELGETVILLWRIGASGLVIGRSEFVSKDPQYYVQYSTDDGRLFRNWVDEDAIDHVSIH